MPCNSYLSTRCMNTTAIRYVVVSVYLENVMWRQNVTKWVQNFNCGKMKICNEDRSGWRCLLKCIYSTESVPLKNELTVLRLRERPFSTLYWQETKLEFFTVTQRVNLSQFSDAIPFSQKIWNSKICKKKSWFQCLGAEKGFCWFFLKEVKQSILKDIARLEETLQSHAIQISWNGDNRSASPSW